jgi:type IV pilus assembly protein PilV
MMGHTHFTTGGARHGAAGFSLVEVLVALIVISIGLLGIAKLQAVALSSTSTAGKRSLAAIQAASLASSMHADRAYWCLSTTLGCLGPAPVTATISGATVTAASDPRLTSGADCWNSRPCTAVNMAAYDLTNWALSAQSILPGYTATIACPLPPAATYPLTCTITLTWTENTVAANAQGNQGGGTAAFQTPVYVLYVEP